MTRIRTLNFLPEIFQTSTNRQFLGATLDQIVNPPVTKKIQGYVGSKFGYGVNANDYYVTEPTKTRTDYQLDPGIIFTKPNESVAEDFISYPGLLDAIKEAGGITDNNNRLFNNQFYSWDSFTNLDKVINYHQYYWIPEGPPAVTVSSSVVFATTDFIVNDLVNGYNISALGGSSSAINPTLTLLRGGTYTFTINQDSPFWIQTEPGVSGYSETSPNQYIRDVFGVINNGISQGVVTFNVPSKDAQDDFNLPGNNPVNVVSTAPFDQVNGAPLSTLGSIDGVTSLEGLTVMFYNTGVPNEIGYVSNFYDYTEYDTNNTLTPAETINVTQTIAAGNLITCSSTANLVVDSSITFSGTSFGGLSNNTIYYVTSVVNSIQFTVSESIGGTPIAVTDDTGTMTGNINQGLYEQGYYVPVNEYFFTITYAGDPTNPVLRLIPSAEIPVNQKITAQNGSQYIGLHFYKDPISGVIARLPYITAPLDTLYYQDGSSPNKVGVIRLIESNLTNTIDVERDILGNKNYTSTNGVVFTNGLKVMFDGDVIPSSYLEGEYYVEGVGSAIELIPVSEMVCPEDFTFNKNIPYDSTSYDIGNYDAGLNIPVDQDYITIARNAINKNAWSRSNRWFHIDVINATAQYNNNTEIPSIYATRESKAKRPIIEFYPNLRLFDFGTLGKRPVDFIDYRSTDALSQVAGQVSYYPDVQVYSSSTATIAPVVSGTSTTVTIDANQVTGTLAVNQYLSDSTGLLPLDSIITAISGTSTLTITVTWDASNLTTIPATSNVSIVADDISNVNYALFPGSRIIFAADTTESVRNKIYLVDFSTITTGSTPVITLTEAEDGDAEVDTQVVITRGYNYQGKSFHYTGITWDLAQQKITVNQPPLFDIFDANGISFGDSDVYVGTSFRGTKLFSYGVGTGGDDSILGFPLRYSAVNNLGDISFDVSLNIDTFSYTTASQPITQKVNTGYVYNYSTRTDYVRELGWQTAVAPSVQYQIFEFDYDPLMPVTTFTCDVAVLTGDAATDIVWPTTQVYINNVLQSSSDYTVTSTDNSTTITISVNSLIETKIQVLLLSNQVSSQSYYSIPINLNNNPFNADIITANIGDIRGQYQSIYTNSPDTAGAMFGANNYRDLGNLVPYGTRIIQNSASLVLPGAFMRDKNHNLFDALLFNSREYVKFKTLLVDTVNNTDYEQRFNPSIILDDALDQITAAKSQEQPFFWSDMLPSKAAYVINTYTFQNSLDISIYPLTKVYDFSSANYDGVLVYLQRTQANITTVKQLIRGVDYTINTDSPSLTITLDLLPNDIITIKEYNQTYGSYVPNTPTKLGLYPSYIPEVVLDTGYNPPTYFIKGHDGSYNKLYGNYDPVTGILTDFRDQALFEFELRIYNNLKLSSVIPIQEYEVLPGFFRETDYSYDEFLQIYSPAFLNWIGQNRLDYKRQLFNTNNSYTYNYSNSTNRIDKSIISMGYWRGIYEYFFDTSMPNVTPWEMIGYANKPTWWETRYGPAPYTIDNLVLWNDMANGIDWNNGEPIVIPQAIRPDLLTVLPVTESGGIVSPLFSVVGNYNPNIFQRDWKVGDDGPVEFSYRRSSSWPFDLMRLLALTKPARFFNLGVDLDNYKYNPEFNQWLVNNRSHLIPSNIEIYGSGTAKTSYINWIVDYQKQVGIDATQNIKDLLFNLDVRLVYRLAGYSDKTMLKFYVEKGTPNSTNASLLIPDESYQVLLYDNQPYDRLVYSSVVIQVVNNGYAVFGNSQVTAYFKTLAPVNNGNKTQTTVEDLTVNTANDYQESEILVPYGSVFYTPQEISQFLISYGKWLESKGAIFDDIQFGTEINWLTMVAEFLYWAQTGWEVGSVITLNPAASILKVDKESQIVQPLTIQQSNFVLNQDLYPIQSSDMCIVRDGTYFSVKCLNVGDTISYGQFNLSNFEHGIVFDNVTLFNDIIYNLITGLRQIRIAVQGTKTAEWNGTVTASGFILNQDNITEWKKESKYTKGSIVKYKNRYWTALTIVQPNKTFNDNEWKVTDYNEIQKGLLPNSSTRSYESALYYNVDRANLESDADLLSFSLIGYRPRDYLALADLTDITQVNVYKNMIKSKGTRNAISAFKGANLPQGGIDYEVYENWAIKSGEFGGILNSNFVEFKLSQNSLTSNPSLVALTNGIYTPGVQQEVPLYSLFNYSRPVTDPNILPTLSEYTPSALYPDAGYVNFNDVKMSSYYYSQLANAVNKSGIPIPITDFYIRDYVWIANYLNKWQVFTPESIGQVIKVASNLNDTATVTFAQPHGLSQYQLFAIVNFAEGVDGYYIVSAVINPYQILIILSIDNNAKELTGQGIGMKFQSQRVDSPADIPNLPLLTAEFTKNTVWVDENNDGSWAVYRKSLNYEFDQEVTKTGSDRFGSAVAYDSTYGYLIGDAGLGQVYRYTDVTQSYNIQQTLTGSASFGSAIVNKENIYVISQPTGTPEVYIYCINNSLQEDDLIPYQAAIPAPMGVTDWGSSLALSGDTNWLYISDIDNNKIYVYRKQNIELEPGYFNVGETYTITSLYTTYQAGSFTIGETYTILALGTTDFTQIGAATNEVGETFVATGIGTGTGLAHAPATDFSAIGAIENAIGITFIATGIGTGTGSATQCTYVDTGTQIDASGFLTSGDNFGYSLATDYYGDTVVIGAPNKDEGSISNWGASYVYHRTAQTFEVQYNSPSSIQTFSLIWTPVTTTTAVSATNATGNLITLTSTVGINVDDPIIFAGSGLLGTDIIENYVYYVESIVGSDITIKESRSTTTQVAIQTNPSIASTSAIIQTSPLYVTVNGSIVTDKNYAINGNTFIYTAPLQAGDLISVSGNEFTLMQVLTSSATPRPGVQFGKGLDTTKQASEILVGAPFELSSSNQEGFVYRFTNGGGKYGQIVGTSEVNVTAPRTILLNGYAVNIPVGNADAAATAINGSQITNIQAIATDNKLVIQVINTNLTIPNEKLLISSYDVSGIDLALPELGIDIYTETQVIGCPHVQGPTQFGTTIKFNEFDSFVASAPVGTRYAATTFDFIDDENLDNDTVFDNNATQWVDSYPNAGAVYMFDYLSIYNENISNTGSFVYAQSINARNEVYGNRPLYGQALAFNEFGVLVGTPNFRVDTAAACIISQGDGGQVISYINSAGVKDWTVYRSTSEIVDINRIDNIQIFSAETNNTLDNLDYIDPLQGKILGAVRQNIDVVSNVDPASYNNIPSAQQSIIWGASKVGSIWFNTSNVRFVNYHQNDVVYNSEYWGTLFPGSDVAIYSWVESTVPPIEYSGPGTPYDLGLYSVQSKLNASNIIIPMYYFWVRNTNIIFTKRGKTLADSIIESYILSPKNSGITYFAPLLPNAFALYNAQQYINANDSVLHIGYSNGITDDVAHNEYSLIRANFADDFLPGVPGEIVTNIHTGLHGLAQINSGTPESLYDRLLDSLSGVDEAGEIVPNPWLPKAVQSGILARPRQSFFYNRFLGLKNYLLYANEVLKQFPITETRRTNFLFAENPPIYDSVGNLLFASGQLYYTPNYWEYVNWWAPGYNDKTKAVIQVPIYADLSTLTVSPNTVVSVAQNGQGKTEFYRYDGNNVWTRIGLQGGTIQFKSILWDYEEGRLGFGDNFYDTNTYDEYPSEETRYIIRALNEQIYTDELRIFRNKSLILLFEYIQSETIESQNYLPWLSKTSLVDVSHKIRELRPIEVYQSDNQDFLAGYLNEVKPYHVVIKEFLFTYTGEDIFEGNITDFDLPAQYNTEIQQFVSPQLVYNSASGYYQYLPTDSIWQTSAYNQWFENRGVSITGQPEYLMTKLVSYVTTASTSIIVENAYGFPINGTILIGTELIGYASVDRSLNVLSGLIRGINGTTIANHIPGELIYMNLPPVVLLNGGRSYSNPPKVTAYIDTTVYPEPTREAVLEAVMSLDSVIQINVIDAGQGYAVLPEIIIDPSITVTFSSSDINALSNTIRVYAPGLSTGDLIRYKAGANGINIGGLQNNQWYYVNLLESVPVAIIALYTSYSDAINDRDRVVMYSIGAGDDHTLNLGARASAISTAAPVRENNIELRFDRTTYNSQIIDWEEGAFYGAFFSGGYTNFAELASSSLLLYSTDPNIENIYASNGGVALQITDVENDRQVIWSSFERTILQTLSGNIIELYLDLTELNPATLDTASGSTIGFTVGMPIKFIGDVSGSNLLDGETYYIESVVDESKFTVMDENGTPISLNPVTISAAGLKCYVAQVIDTAILTVNYPGIRTATQTDGNINAVTVPVSPVGTGGTAGLYPNVPIFFTGTDFGRLVSNQVYYVISILDSERFTISETPNPLTTTVTDTTVTTNIVTVDDTEGFNVNDAIVFAGVDFGGISSGTVYYVREIVNGTELQISETINGPAVVLSTASGNMSMVSQVTVLPLTTATGSMTLEINLPVSPGQVTGQEFTLYSTSANYPNITITNVESVITAQGAATISVVNRIAVSGTGTTGMYINMPVQFSAAVGGLLTGTTYWITNIGQIGISVTDTLAGTNEIVCDATDSLYVDMPIVFSGSGIGNIIIGATYYVRAINSATHFTVSTSPGGSTFTLTTDGGVMIGTGEYYIQVCETAPGNPAKVLTSVVTPFTITQYPDTLISPPEISVNYVLGGYDIIIVNSSTGYAIDNTLLIAGDLIGGTTPENDLTLSVNGIGTYGEILNVSAYGISPEDSNNYYLKVISANKLAVYQDVLLQQPVSGVGFNYKGIESTTVTGTQASVDLITVTDVSGFNVNDTVIFTGNVTGAIDKQTRYYVITVDYLNNQLQISNEPGGSVFTLTTTSSQNYMMAKPGDYAFLAQPFFFKQSIVVYNNNVYLCVISNNDNEFIFGKWQLLRSDDRRLNGLDRVIGYYQPTDDMPGKDLTQLVTGITYPNSTYLGNAFEPDQQYAIDTVIIDPPFYPTGVDLVAIANDGSNYVAPANLPEYTALAIDDAGTDWDIYKLANSVLNVTDIIYANGLYLITSTNSATPIFKSTNRITWTTTGYYTSNGNLPWISDSTGMIALNSAGLSLNAIGYDSGIWHAVGEGIVSSNDGYIWRQTYTSDPLLQYELYGIAHINVPAFVGFIAVGKGKRYDYSSGVTELVDNGIILVKGDGTTNWSLIPPLTTKGFYSVATDGANIVVVGEDGVIYNSQNGSNWFGVTEARLISTDSISNLLNITTTQGFAINDVVRFTDNFDIITAGTDYYIVSILSSTQVQIATGPTPTPPISILTTGGLPSDVIVNMYKYPESDTLIDMLYANSRFMAVGDNGRIAISTDTITWTNSTTGTTNNLNGLTEVSGTYTVVGDDNTVLQSIDNGLTWTAGSAFTVSEPIYNVIGDPFAAGYGPEELVPGVVEDNLTMIVTTRPGTNWPTYEYASSGYNVVSLELTPISSGQTEYSFSRATQTSAQIGVFQIDYATGLSTSLYEGIDYTVDWVNKVVILNSPLPYTPSDLLRIDVYEVGNGDQLVKASTESDPIRINTTTGFNEIYLNCNYTAPVYLGSGVMRPTTIPIEVQATETDSLTNYITCANVSNFVINDPITFSGGVFGGLQEDTQYYVKSISYATNSITVSSVFNVISGTAGPTFEVTSATGSMYVVIQVGSGTVWTDPIVYHNGTKLVLGKTNTVTRTKSSNNAITTISTGGMIANTPIVFCDCMFGNVIVPQQTYYIESIIDGNEFTISATSGGPVLPLTDAAGGAMFITNDYAFALASNGVSAKIMFAAQYDATVDYLSYTMFGETAPVQYGYTIPEVQTFISDGSVQYYITDFIGDDNDENAIVELDGIRQTASTYVIDMVTNTITFTPPPAIGARVAITTFNDTNNQYLNTLFGVTGSAGSGVGGIVGSTTHVELSYDDLVLAGGFDVGQEYVIQSIGTTDFTLIGAASNTVGLAFIATGAGTGTGTAAVGYGSGGYDAEINYLTLSSGTTAVLSVNDAITFSSPTIGGIIAGVTYYIVQIMSSTEFVISSTVGGTPYTLYDDTGSMTISTTPLVVANITGIINSLNAPTTTTATATTASTDEITCVSTGTMVVGQTVEFKAPVIIAPAITSGKSYRIESVGTTDFTLIGAASNDVGVVFTATGAGSGTGTVLLTSFGGISTLGTVYYIRTVGSGVFQIEDENANLITLTNDTANIIVVIGGLTAVRVVTGIDHEFSDNSLIQIDGVLGSVQLNNNVYYAKVINSTQFDLYTQPYNPAYAAVNYPVTDVSSYISGGYTWLSGLFKLRTTEVTATTSGTNILTVTSTIKLIAGTPVYFSEKGVGNGATTIGGLITGQKYYIKDILSGITITISDTLGGDEVILTSDTGYVYLTQWEQTNVDRLWVTVAGYRVPSSKLSLNSNNDLSILTVVQPGDEVIITSMVPTATPNEEVYMLQVNSSNDGVVYRANPETRTWLTQPLFELDNRIYVNDVTRITNLEVQNVTAPSPISGIYSIGLTADKTLISDVTVYNNTTGLYIDNINYEIVIEALSPILKIQAGAYITAGDSLTISVLVGNLIYINGEQIRFSEVDFTNNSLSGIQRGYNDTGAQTVIPVYSEVYSFLSNNLMTNVNYNQTWNSNIFNPVEGDPLQISVTEAAEFLKVDIT